MTTLSSFIRTASSSSREAAPGVDLRRSLARTRSALVSAVRASLIAVLISLLVIDDMLATGAKGTLCDLQLGSEVCHMYPLKPLQIPTPTCWCFSKHLRWLSALFKRPPNCDTKG